MENDQDKSVPELPVSGFDFARTIIEQKGDAAIDILLEAAHLAETDWLEKKAAVYPSETADPSYKSLLEKLEKAPPETRRRERDLYGNKLLREIACAVVALHNSRGGVVLVGVDDDNKPVPLMADADNANLPRNGPEVESFVRMEVLGRLCPEGGVFVCKGGNWRIPVGKTGVYPNLCRFHESSVVALLVPPLGRGKAPLVVTITENNKSRDSVLLRMPGDVGQTQKGTYEDRWVGTEAQKADFLQNRDNRFLFREDLSVKLRDLGLSVSHLPVIPSIEAPAREVFSSVNQPRANNFVGREKELAELHSLLQKGRIPVVTGPGGTGKTELVLQYAEQHKNDYKGGLFQIDMEEVKSWDDAFRQLLGTTRVGMWNLLGFHKPNGNKSGKNEERWPSKKEIAGALARRTERDERILLVLDNIESVKAFLCGPVFEELSLPKEVCIVATARTADVKLPADRAIEHPLSDLSPEAALALLFADKKAENEEERKSAGRIAALLGYRALYLRRVPMLIGDLYKQTICDSYTELAKALEENLLETVAEETEGTHLPEVLWKMTREKLLKMPLGNECVKLALIAAFFSPEGFPKHILQHLWKTVVAPGLDERKFERVFDIVRHHNIFQADDPVRVHRLDRAAILAGLGNEKVTLEESVGKSLARYDGMSPDFWLSLSDSPYIMGFIPEPILQSKDKYLAFGSECAPSLQVRLLLQNQNYEELVRWQLLDCSDWLAALETNPGFASRPEFAQYCSWEKLNGKMWARLLGKRPQFANYCLWDKLGGTDWAVLLSYQPQFETKADELRAWERLEGVNWAWLLINQPRFSRVCHWEKLDSTGWGWLLGKRPQFIPQFETYCKWEKLEGTGMAMLLSKQPQFAEYCDLGILRSHEWLQLLQSQPQFADRCPWELFDCSEWFDLLGKQPQFADRCPKEFLAYSSSNWLQELFWPCLLEKQPQLAKLCLEHNPNAMGWALFLSYQPEAADGCPWEEFGGRDWARLLARQPQFKDRCKWDKLNGHDWRFLLENQPQIADTCRRVPWEELDGFDWAQLLESQPQLAVHCLWWGKLDDSDWNNLLLVQPQFAIHRSSGPQS